MLVNKDYGRGFLIAASAYQRHADGFVGDFSADALREQFDHETHGGKVSPNNGYAVGKWSLGVTLSAMREDYIAGHFCKFEMLSGSCAFVRREIRKWVPMELFAWRGRA